MLRSNSKHIVNPEGEKGKGCLLAECSTAGLHLERSDSEGGGQMFCIQLITMFSIQCGRVSSCCC